MRRIRGIELGALALAVGLGGACVRPAGSCPGGCPVDSGQRADSGTPDGGPAVAWGMWLFDWQGGGGADAGVVFGEESVLGHRVDLVHWYAADTESWSYDGSLVDDVLAMPRTPMITWEFWNDSVPGIIAGTYDSYLDSWAAGMAARAPATIYLRIFHEFNDPYSPSSGSGYPWGICGGTSNTATDLVNAYRHVHARFALAGATNVKFLWTPDGTFSSTGMYGNSCGSLSAAWPGDAYVDFAGWDSYDYDNGALYGVMTAVTSKPLILAETGTRDTGLGPAWVNTLSGELNDGGWGAIRGVVWFNQGTWLLSSNPNTQAAVINMLATPAFR